MTAAAVRTDRDPLTKRFPRLGDFAETHWVGAAAGVDTGGVPGPTDVLIQAFVVLRPGDLATAKSAYAWAPATAGWESTVKEELRPYRPTSGDWRQSDQYGSDLRTNAYAGTVYIDLVSGTVFLDLMSR